MRRLEHAASYRRDLRVYAMLLVGAGFVYAGLTVDPATNCDESGRECAPWLVPVALCMGVAFAGAALAMLYANRRWGSRLDLARGQLLWWDNAAAPGTHAIALEAIARIRVQHPDESEDRLFLYGHDGARIRFPEERAVPYAPAQWARDLAARFPHIEVVEEDNG